MKTFFRCQNLTYVASFVVYLGLCQGAFSLEPSDNIGLVKTKPSTGIAVKTDSGYMVAYTAQIPGTEVAFEMVPIPGGEFLLGTRDSEAERREDEGPQVKIRVEPFWMAKHEITWAEYHVYMSLYNAFKQINELRSNTEDAKSYAAVKAYLDQESLDVDGVTAPTPLYDPDAAYAAGEEPNQPAVTMTQFAAKQYTQWISGISGLQYRLPSEVEWEYAARAGTTTAYWFGDDPEKLVEYGWFDDNADFETHPVGSLPANPWGLHDMHGNAAEWVLDGYLPEQYKEWQNKTVKSTEAIAWPKRRYPRVIRGGSWLDDAASCRSGARQPSEDADWAIADPNLPVSPWWFTEEPSSGIGFRIVRPLKPMSQEQLAKVWKADIEGLKRDVDQRLVEGRGTESSADPRLPAAIQDLQSAGLVD